MFKVIIKKSVSKDLLKIGEPAATKVLHEIWSTLAVSPSTAGKKLKGELAEVWSYRVGDYRVLYTFNNQEMWVLVVKVGHRKNVYD